MKRGAYLRVPTVAQLVPILMTAIGPAILISAVGMLLLTLTNRLARTIDRSRILTVQLAQPVGRRPRTAAAQLDILWRRAHLIRLSIILASASALSAALLVVVLFVTALLGLEVSWLIGGLFIGCMGLLVASLATFIHDINQTLLALKLETAEAREPPAPAGHA